MPLRIVRWHRRRDNRDGRNVRIRKDPNGARVHKLKSEPRALKQRGERLAGGKPGPRAFRATPLHDRREIEELQPRLLTKGAECLIEWLGRNVYCKQWRGGRTGQRRRKDA